MFVSGGIDMALCEAGKMVHVERFGCLAGRGCNYRQNKAINGTGPHRPRPGNGPIRGFEPQ
ncbi:hypothetical protein GCM10023219_20520 [Stakelama sediminis]